MIVNLANVSYMTVSGTRIELHFKDSSTYMNRFGSVRELHKAFEDWQEKTRILNGGPAPLPTNYPALKGKSPATSRPSRRSQ